MATEIQHPTKSPHVSFSQLYLAAMCGEAYRLKYVEAEDPGDTDNLPSMAGSAFHAAVERWESAYFRSKIPAEAARLEQDDWWAETTEILEVMTKRALNDALEAHDKDEGDIKYFGQQDLRHWRTEKLGGLAKTYLDFRRIEFARGFDWFGDEPGDGIELECRAEIGGFPFLAYIDMIFLDSNGKIVIRDLKTGDTKGHHTMQLEQYRLALKRAHGIEADYGQLLYVKRSKPYVQVIDWNLSDDEVEEQSIRLRRNIEGGTLMINGPYTGHCTVCDFQPQCPWGDVTPHGSS